MSITPPDRHPHYCWISEQKSTPNTTSLGYQSELMSDDDRDAQEEEADTRQLVAVAVEVNA